MYRAIIDQQVPAGLPQTIERDHLALTAREAQVITCLATGMTAFAIGSCLGISAPTVRKHLEHAYSKLQCNDRVSAINTARQAGLIP